MGLLFTSESVANVTNANQVLVSACLLGVSCRYDGLSKPLPAADRLGAQALIPVCPEVMAGFGVPRPAIERRDDGRVVVCDSGDDVTERLERAANAIADLALAQGVTTAWLKEYSPSCGSTFLKRGGTVVAGEGLAAAVLRRRGLTVLPADGPCSPLATGPGAVETR